MGTRFNISIISLVVLSGFICFYTLNLLSYTYYTNDIAPIEKICAIFLLGAFSLWSAQLVGYIDHLLKSVLLYKDHMRTFDAKRRPHPDVAVFIPIYNEDPNIVRDSIKHALSIQYNNHSVYLVDDSNNPAIRQQLEALGHEFPIVHLHRTARRGHKAGAINDALRWISASTKYVLILDVDHQPQPNILDELVPLLEGDDQLSFVQTPQYFASDVAGKIPLAYSFQQHIFHKHVCRGLDVNNAVFMCGTNLIFRVAHLRAIGGMDENCITEDVATSLTLHLNGYKSLYVDAVYAKGQAPNSLSAYFTQQMRWAHGTVENCKRCILHLFRDPSKLSITQWWEYIVIHGLWYFFGFASLIWIVYTVAVLLGNLRPLILFPVDLPLFVFVAMISSQILTSIRDRGYRLRDLILAQGLFYNLFPVYILASMYSLLGKKIDFVVTPKGKKTDLISLKKLFPQAFILGLLITSIFVGIYRAVAGDFKIQHLYVIMWAIYNTATLASVFYFYNEDRKNHKQGYTI